MNKPKQTHFYKRSGVIIASFFGSVLTGAYLTAHNLKLDGRHLEVKKVYAIASIILILGIIIPIVIELITRSQISINSPFVLIQILSFIYFFDKKVYKKEELESKTSHLSDWRAFGISLIAFIILMLTLYSLLFIAEALFK